MEFQIQRVPGNSQKRSLLVAYQHQYAEDCTDATYPLMDTSAAIIDMCLDSVFSPEGSALITSTVGDGMSNRGLVVLITSETDWTTKSHELLSDLSTKGLDTLIVVCGSSTSLSEPYLDKATAPSKGIFIIRTEPSWLRRLLGGALWTYGRPLGLITPNIGVLVDAFLSFYPRHTAAHVLCHVRFEDEIDRFTQRVASDTASWGEARYVFVAIASIDITVGQLEYIGHVLREHFPSGTTFGIQLGTDERNGEGAMQIATMVFYESPLHNRSTPPRSLH